MTDINNKDLIMVMKAQAWEKAKGELKGIGALFIGSEDGGKSYEEYTAAIDDFIKNIEENGIGGFT